MRTFLFPMLLLAAPAVNSTVCARLDAHGQLRVSDVAATDHAPCFHPLGHAVFAPPRAMSGKAAAAEARRPKQYDRLILQMAAQTGVEARLLHAVIHVESHYNHRARSRAGAIGLMQVMPLTGKRFGVTHLLDPRQNMLAGASYLRWLMRRFRGDMTLVLAAYNAGEGAVARHGNHVPDFTETREYVARVLARYALG